MKRDNPTKRAIFLKSLASSAASQIFSVVVGLISVPIGLSYLGPLQYGIWIVITTIIAYLSLSQFGIGTASAALIGKQVERKSQGVIFRQSILLLSYLALFSMAFAGIAALFPSVWASLFGAIDGAARHEALTAAIVLMAMYLLRLPVIAFTSAFFGLQEVHWERLYSVVLPVSLSFLALLLTIYFGGSLLMLAYLTGGAQLIAGLLAVLHFFMRHRDMFCGTMKQPPDVNVTKELLSSGSRFFFIGISSMVVWSTDNLVISYFIGPESVTAYAVTFKLFAAAFSLITIANSVLMPMFGNAFARNDWSWIQKTYKNGLSIMVILGGLVAIGGVLFAKSIILMWTGVEGYGGVLVILALSGYGYVISSVSLTASLLSGMNSTRTLLWIGIAEAVVNFLLSIIFIRWWGIGGVALGTFLSALLTVYWLLPMDVARQTHSRVKVSWSPLVRHFGCAILPGVGAAYLFASIADRVTLWAGGLGLCVIYLTISWFLLPSSAKTMFVRIYQRSI